MPRVHILGTGSAALAVALGLHPSSFAQADVALFLVSAKDGIDRANSDQWLAARELYIPSIVVITDLSALNETDFEDMSTIAARILDPVVTPFLVLHAENGSPVALIDLESQMIIDYSEMEVSHRVSDREHQELIAEFRAEYLESVMAAGEGAFENGLLFPAIPWINGSQMGLMEIKSYLKRIPTIG